MQENKSVKVSTKQRLFLASVMVVLLIIGVLIFTWDYSSVWKGKNAAPIDGGRQNLSMDTEQFARDYKNNFSSIIAVYLSASGELSSDFSSFTQETKNKLLDLKVPAINKDIHLSTILSLERVESRLAENNQAELEKELQKIRNILDTLQ